MSDVVIRVEGLSKRYRIGAAQPRYHTLRDRLGETLSSPLKRIWRAGKGTPRRGGKPDDTIWALRDVSFEIKRGEVVGVIGRNGAGKTTLLKILSRITEPTTGYAEVRGVVGSLLEVGTGFHPELTGRENVYLNGAILGMRRAEVERRFDEIVAFAEVEKFLDTPVKHYSTGMQVRLAFAVAAHLDTEILAVDEVLAVGDAPFQRKCVRKMEGATSAGRTVLFVSHNMNAVEQLCGRALLLDAGLLKMDSHEVRSVLLEHTTAGTGDAYASIWERHDGRFENPYFRPLRLAIVDENGKDACMPVRNDADVWLEVEGYLAQRDPALTIGYAIYAPHGVLLYWSYETDERRYDRPPLFGRIRMRSKLPRRLLNEGVYRIELIGGLHFREWLFEPGQHNPCVYIAIQGGLSDSPYWTRKRPGLLAPSLPWEVVS